MPLHCLRITKIKTVAKGNSYAKLHYWREKDTTCLKSINPYSGPPVILPDEDTLEPENQVILSLSNKLTKKAKITNKLPNLRRSPLISLGFMTMTALFF